MSSDDDIIRKGNTFYQRNPSLFDTGQSWTITGELPPGGKWRPVGGGGSESGISTGGPVQADPPNPLTVAIPGYTDEQVGPALSFGWNSGAHSLQTLPSDWHGLVQFDVPDVLGTRPAGVAIGLAYVDELPVDYRNGYAHLRYGLVFTIDEVKVLLNGAEVASFDYPDIRAERDAGSGTDQVYALMYGDAIRWVVNGQSLFYGQFTMPGNYALDATLYSGFDAVDNPAFVEGDWGAEFDFSEDGTLTAMLPGLAMTSTWEQSLQFALPGLAAVFSEDDYADISGALGALAMSAGDSGGIAGSLAPLEMVAAESESYAAIQVALPALRMAAVMADAAGDPAVRYSLLAPYMPGLRMTGTLVGEMRGEMVLPALTMRASSEATYSEINAPLPALAMNAYGDGMTNFLDLTEQIYSYVPVLYAWTLGVAFTESIDSSDSITLLVVAGEDVSEQISAAGTVDLTATILDGLVEQIGLAGRTELLLFNLNGSDALPGDAWAVNTHTSASSRYDRFGFSSFATVLGQSFGAKHGGLYLLDGTNDAGAAITSGVALGKRTFGTSALKRLDAVYIGVSSAGNMFLKVSDGTTSYTYTARATGANLRTQRFDIGKGLRANYLTFEITNETDRFELDTVEFNVLASARRIQ